MEAISVKLDAGILQHLDAMLKEHHYSTRTDFIREAIRDKLEALRTKNAIRAIERNRGKGKGKRPPLTDERLHEIREEVARELARKLGVPLE